MFKRKKVENLSLFFDTAQNFRSYTKLELTNIYECACISHYDLNI